MCRRVWAQDAHPPDPLSSMLRFVIPARSKSQKRFFFNLGREHSVPSPANIENRGHRGFATAASHFLVCPRTPLGQLCGSFFISTWNRSASDFPGLAPHKLAHIVCLHSSRVACARCLLQTRMPTLNLGQSSNHLLSFGVVVAPFVSIVRIRILSAGAGTVVIDSDRVS